MSHPATKERERVRNESVRITITTSKQVEKYLAGLVGLGLYGTTIAEAAEQLICEGLRNDLRSKRKTLLSQ